MTYTFIILVSLLAGWILRSFYDRRAIHGLCRLFHARGIRRGRDRQRHLDERLFYMAFTETDEDYERRLELAEVAESN